MKHIRDLGQNNDSTSLLSLVPICIISFIFGFPMLLHNIKYTEKLFLSINTFVRKPRFPFESLCKNIEVLPVQNNFCSLLCYDTLVGLDTKDILAFGNLSLFIQDKTVT